MARFSSSDYATAGLATLSRQCICEGLAHAPYKTGEPFSTAALIILKLAAHRAQMAATMLDTIVGYASSLVEVHAFGLLLQISEEMDDLMAAKIPQEEKQLAILKIILPLIRFTNPLGWLSFSNYINSFQAQIDAHNAVLAHFRSLWETKITKVTYVSDGDTIYVDAYEDSIRIEGVDCPEIWHEEKDPEGSPDDEQYAAGYAAKDFTTEQLLGKEVELKTRIKRDDYGRIIAKVYIDGKDFVNAIVLNGHGKFIFWGF